MKYIKTIQRIESGYLVNSKVIIDDNGVLWNDFANLKPYKDFPQYYFLLRDELMKGAK